jgi:response regulator of citrate/malate metabolism
VLVVTIDDDRAHALALGACEHMVKPVDRDKLTSAVMRYTLPRSCDAHDTASTTQRIDAKRFA